MRYLLTALIIVALLASSASAFERELEIGADGRIEINSVVFNSYTKAGLDIRGVGVGNISAITGLNETEMQQAYGIEIAAAENALRPLRAITALTNRTADARHDYALMIAPSAGEMGRMNVAFDVVTPMPGEDALDEQGVQPGDNVWTFAGVEVAASVQLSGGEFRSYVDMFSPVSMSGMKEEVRIRGQVFYEDSMSFDKLKEIEIKVPE